MSGLKSIRSKIDVRSPDLDKLLRELDAMAPMGIAVGLHIKFASPLLHIHTYPEEWVRIYSEGAYALRDPLIWWGSSTRGATRWSEIDLPDPFGVWSLAAQFELNYGVAVACGPMLSRTVVGIARADREFTDEEIARAEAIVLRMHKLTEPPRQLTKAQVEALKCIADGDRLAAAAFRLGISESAIKARLASARERLGVRTLPEAIQKAQNLRLI